MCSTATATNKRDESRQRCSTGALGHNHHQNLPVFWSGGDDDDKDDGGGGALKRSEEYNNSKKFAANFEMQKKVDRSVCICVHLCVNQAVHSHKLSASRLEQLMITNRKCVCQSRRLLMSSWVGDLPPPANPLSVRLPVSQKHLRSLTSRRLD